jgi:hypothetical protein
MLDDIMRNKEIFATGNRAEIIPASVYTESVVSVSSGRGVESLGRVLLNKPLKL